MVDEGLDRLFVSFSVRFVAFLPCNLAVEVKSVVT